MLEARRGGLELTLRPWLDPLMARPPYFGGSQSGDLV